jgi:hypothetical protein
MPHKPTTVTIEDNKPLVPNPLTPPVYVGDIIYWAIKTGSGIAIMTTS